MHLCRNIGQERSSGAPMHANAATPVVFIVDSDPSVRESLESLVRGQGWRSLAFARAAEFLDQPPVPGACCLLLDVDLPDLNGLELQQRVAHRGDMPVVFITGDTDIQTVVNAMKAGALEYLAKPLRNDELLCAISFALERSGAVLAREAVARTVRDCHDSLSVREREVMERVASGWLNKQVGAALGITEITVKVHRSNLMRKMKATSLADLVMKARALGLKNLPVPNGPFLRSLEKYAGARNLVSQAHAST